MCSREKVRTLSPHKSVEADRGSEMIRCCWMCVILVNIGAVRLWADWKKKILDVIFCMEKPSPNICDNQLLSLGGVTGGWRRRGDTDNTDTMHTL